MWSNLNGLPLNDSEFDIFAEIIQCLPYYSESIGKGFWLVDGKDNPVTGVIYREEWEPYKEVDVWIVPNVLYRYPVWYVDAQ